MKKNFFLTLVLALVALFSTQTVTAQAPVDSPEQAITGLLNRIGGNGAAGKFEIVIDASLAENGKDVFIITSQNGKPCIKGNTQLSVATGINWYLNHHAHINLTWNNLTTDLVNATLPVPGSEEKHVCNTTYRYDFNTCTFSYSMAFWTWERWQQEIDWMALHGINAPLNLVGLDVVTRKFLRELGVSENDINAYIAGPGFIAWFAMNNLEGWGGTINSSSTGVNMNGNPDWWYTRQEQLCRNMLQRMRELGMQPVIPGFSGQVPNCIVNYSINGFSSGDVVNNGTWAGGYTRPDILKPNTTSYQTFATVYYKHLHEVMGVSELYSIDPFHEGSLPSGVTNATCYPNIMAELDKHFGNVEQSVKDTYKVTKSPSWIIQYWQGVPQSGAFTAMKNAGYTNRFIGLDLFADNIYADNAAKWRTNYYDTCPYIYCMLHNFGGRSGLHGRLETTMDGYFQALAKNNNCQGIGATPEGTETNPILYDMLFELPWMSSNPGADAWLAEYAHSRYGVDSKTAPAALEALKNLKKSVWDCKVNQQGTSEAVILARPNWTINSVSSWSTAAIYWDTQDVLLAADQLYSVKDLVTANGGQDGIANYNYDFIDVVRQAMVDYAAQLLPLINAAHNSGNNAEYTRLYQLYLQLMLDLDTMLSYDENFKLERWTSLARNIADEVEGTTENDRNWLEWNARTQVTVWSKGNTDLHDYSNRCWAGLIKDFHYKRWKQFFENNGNAFSGGWYSGFEYPWTVDFNETYNLAGDYSKVVIPTDMTATEKAAETFGNYFGRIKGATKNYIFPMGVATNATKSDVIPEVYRGQEVELPLIIGKNVTISSVWVDLNADGNAGNGETLTANGNNVTIPADAAIGKTTAKVTYSDGTIITFNLALIEDITTARTVTAVAGANGSVAIEGTNELSITTTEAVKMTATANTGYNFENWTKDGEVVSNDNPFIYYGKEAAEFTANFIQDKWGVPTEDKSDWGDATVKTSFVNELTFAYYNRAPETIYEASVAPDNLFNTIPQIINVPQGASFDVTWSDNGDNGLQFCCLSAYIDLNADGDFTDEGELLKVAGTKGAKNTAACEGKINVILPYDAPLGITHMRLRFDGAWKDAGYDAATKSYDAKAQLNRMCYEIVINVTEKSDKAATINVETNSADWGTVEVWTDETPDGSTGTQWVVSANIPMYLRATKASEDVEFLGWYDQYGRLVTENLEHTMYAREDATYTARFRKFLEIDGWQIEYRTEPGKDVVTTKLANGVKPEAGKKYYIYAPTRPTNDGEYVNRYLYNNSGTLTLSTTESTAASYLWLCSVEDGKYVFQNVADPTKFLKHKGLASAPYGFELGTGTTYYEGITMQSVPGDGETRNLFFVINDNGSGFNHSTRAHNQSTEDYTTDFVFTEVTVPDVVILTSVRKSGDHDLVIPESVEILGQQCKIVGFDNNLFKDNKDLWSISLPATIEEMSNNKVFTGVVKGKGANASANTANYITTDLGVTCAAGEDWSISLTITDNGNNFNQWGSALIATGNAPMNDTYSTGFQLYMQAGGGLVVKTDANNDGNKLTNLAKGTKYRIDIVYTHSNTKLVVTATPLGAASAAAARTGVARAAAASLEITQDMSDFSVVSHAIPEGVNITNLEVRKGAEPDPFEGCTNLLGIEVADGCESYYVDEETRTLKSTGGTTLHTLADEDKAEEIRALGELIDLAEALVAEVATVNPTGKATEIVLNATQGNDYYIWCNNPHTSGDDGKGGVAALLDEDASTYLHSNWSSLSSTHDYLQIDFGNAVGLDNFKIAGQQRNGASDDYPKNIEIYGSNNGTDWVAITTVEGLPNTSGATWESGAISAAARYSHLKFVVKTHNNYNQTTVTRPYFHMAKFDLLKLTSTAEVKPAYANLVGVKAEEVEGVYDAMAAALYYYNNGGTAEQLTAAYNVLKPLYDALNAKKDNVFNGVYHVKLGAKPLFVAYTETAVPNMSNDVAGYHLFDATTDNTSDANKDLQNTAIANMAAADALFTIVPNDGNSGYTLSAQGLYLHSTRNGGWAPQLLSNDAAQAGVYLFEETETDIYKIKSNRNDIQYMNDWGAVIGNDKSNKPNLSTFTLTQVTEYTLNVPANGATTLCLPFNVVLPVGVTAYDLPKANVVKGDGYSTYELVEVAAAGETLAKNTPVIIKAAANDYTLTITMNDEAAKGSVENSVLRSGLVKTTVVAGNNYTFDGKNFNIVAADTEIKANQCWMELEESLGTTVIDKSEEPEFYGVYTLQAKSYNDGSHHELDVPIFVAAEGDEYKLFAKGENTEALVEADTYFTITPNDNGYTLQAQGLYVKTPQNLSGWGHILCGAEAGTYLLEDAGDDFYSLESADGGSTKYLNVWYNGDSNYYIGNDDKYSKIAIEKVTEYTLTVPEGGVTTLWLPFNVVLPEGVTAYDVNSFETQNGLCKYTLTELAVAGETLAKNTPVVIKAEQGSYSYTLKITMNNEGVIGSASGSALRGNYWERNLAAGENNYQPAVTADGVVFNRVDAATTVAANTAWLKLTENKGAVIYEEFPEGPDAPTALTDGAVYRIKGRTENGAAYRTVYTNGAGNWLRWTSDAKNDATTLFVAQETADGKFKLVSALGNGLWNNERTLDEDGVGLTLLPGTVDGTFAIRGNGERIFSAHGTSGEMNMYSDGRIVVGENETTDFVFEEVSADEVAFNKIIRKGNHYATLFLPYNVTVPENVKAYTATIENKDQEKQGVISLVEIADGIIPARTAVILRREDNTAIGEFSFKYTKDASSYDYEGNLFGGRVTTGYVGSDNVNERYYLLLNTDTKGEALYKVYREYNSWGGYVGENNGGYIKCEGNKGYMKLDVANGASSSYSFRIEGSTGIEDVEGENGDVKAIYDLQGRKLAEITQPGIYIVDGKKVWVK
ncbi:MAG: alpha-N-acetylglucosaminidase C-terminal domain-containing protein [Bacteroidaceae bacterium]|nr:alpha-N-acetylglucosaminidase C-terminal domain-containing protein [Bacteroidaceae bacterium]